ERRGEDHRAIRFHRDRRLRGSELEEAHLPSGVDELRIELERLLEKLLRRARVVLRQREITEHVVSERLLGVAPDHLDRELLRVREVLEAGGPARLGEVGVEPIEIDLGREARRALELRARFVELALREQAPARLELVLGEERRLALVARLREGRLALADEPFDRRLRFVALNR